MATKYKRLTCDSCQILAINGVACHEQGCPNGHKNKTADCKECGRTFRLKHNGQTLCSNKCHREYYGG